MTLIRELIEIPEQVHKSDFVISLRSAIEQPAETIANYVVTDQLADALDTALGLITSAAVDRKSKSSYLHASFGAGKSAFMAVTNLLLSGETSARAKPELAPLVAKYAGKIDQRKFLLVPYHAIGANTLEQIVLGGYVEYVRDHHPEAPLPAVYLADEMLADAVAKRAELGDETFFRVLSAGEADDDWGDFGAGWDAVRFEAALDAAPGSAERDALVGALLATHYKPLAGRANATAEGFVPIDDGLESISRHAKGLGYDAVVLFLDELVLWLASRAADPGFVAREGNKVVLLVEGDDAKRPAPIVSLIARQRDLRELIGDIAIGSQAAMAADVLRHSEGRFGTITLEDRNLPEIASKRLLRPRTEQARQELDSTFEMLGAELDQRGERDVLLTDTGDLAAFRKLYPFSPALVEALVALSSAMQRERTALKVMLQLLVENRDRLEVGQLVPLGDLFDAINTGDEPLTEVMRAQFAQARRLWSQRLEPLLLRNHSLSPDEVGGLAPTHGFVTDSRLAKSLLIAALVPEVGALRNLTVSRLTALNSGIVRAFIPGTERQQVLDKLRAWASEIGELRLGDDEHDPTVSVVLQGIDTGPILDAAKTVDSPGERKRRVRDMLCEALVVKGADSLEPYIEVEWRGFVRRVDVMFANVRDEVELPPESMRAGNVPKLIVDYPWDDVNRGPADDRARVDDHRAERPAEWTAVWLPNFLSTQSSQLLGRMVRLDYVLTGDNFDRLAAHLTASDRPLARSQLNNEQNAVRERLKQILQQAYGVVPATADAVDEQLMPNEHLHTLDGGLTLRPPAGAGLRAWAEEITRRLYEYRFPKHPDFTEKVGAADLRHTHDHVVRALAQPGGRLENVESTMRKVLTRVANPLQLGTMHSAHFIGDVHVWTDLINKRRAETGSPTPTVRTLRAWLDGADTPTERRGLNREVAELVILCHAAATDQTLVASGSPVTKPEVGKLGDEWELRSQNLPDADVWEAALTRATDMGIVPSSKLRSATAVADLNSKIVEAFNREPPAVRALPDSLRKLAQLVPVNDDLPRMATALTAIKLIDAIAADPASAVEALGALDIPGTAAALGTSIQQASAVTEELDGYNVELIDTAIKLGGDLARDAVGLRDRLAAAVSNEELTTGLVMALALTERSATDLLKRAAASAPAPTGPEQEKEPEPDGETAEARRARVRATAETSLGHLRSQLAGVGLDLTWTIADAEGADGDG
jgi:hypothetical protein